MKKFLLGLCILGLTNLISAQNDLAMATANDNDITIKTSKIKNESYVMNNSNETMHLATRIKKLQKIAATYDISKESIYSNNKSVLMMLYLKPTKIILKLFMTIMVRL
eukprot:TRINITY_DN16559_c0_g1_i1.p1 TRINITY_DN16559_c0_g1~~TRINITY_DN16559_c0_g1_i1.p1  ORF type:complete len:108 (+),score=19.42 TRINITY_DN16559_c0_g1_i1:62-385(+)